MRGAVRVMISTGKPGRRLLTTICATFGFELNADPLDLRHAGGKATDLPFGFSHGAPDQPYFLKPGHVGPRVVKDLLLNTRRLEPVFIPDGPQAKRCHFAFETRNILAPLLHGGVERHRPTIKDRGDLEIAARMRGRQIDLRVPIRPDWAPRSLQA